MKRIFVFLLVVVLVFALAACGGGGSDSDVSEPIVPLDIPALLDEEEPALDDDGPADGAGPDLLDTLICWMIGGTFSYDFESTVTGGGETIEQVGTMAVDGSNFAIASEMSVAGEKVKSKIISKDGKMYVIDDENRMVIIMSGMSGLGDMLEGTMTDYSGIEEVGSGMGEIGGKTLPYVEYRESELGSIVKYYMDGGQVYGIESEFEGYKSVLIITNASNKVPAGAFDIPSGYTEMTF